MSRFAPKFGPEVSDAIKEARASGMAPSEVQRKLAAGTLPGLDRVIEIAPRTFYGYWDRARRELARGKDDRPCSVIERLGIQMALEGIGGFEGIDDFKDRSPQDLAEELGVDPASVAWALDEMAKTDAALKKAGTR